MSDILPTLDGQLAGHKDGSGVVAVLEDFEEIAALVGGELLGPPIVQDEKLGS